MSASNGNGRMRTIVEVDDGSSSSGAEMHTEQLAQRYGLSTRQINKLIVSVTEKGYPMEPRIGARNRRYWSEKQQFWIKMEHEKCLDRHPDAEQEAEQTRVNEFETQFKSTDRPEQVGNELSVLSTQSTLVNNQVNKEWNQGANLAVVGIKARYDGYVTTLPVAESAFEEAIQELRADDPTIPVRNLTASEVAAIRGCLS